MPWLEAIKAAIIAVPKLVDMFQGLLGRLDAAIAAMNDRKLQEIKDAQTQLAREIGQVQNDEQRAAFARRLSELERGHVSHS
jgi:hypothetical protein